MALPPQFIKKSAAPAKPMKSAPAKTGKMADDPAQVAKDKRVLTKVLTENGVTGTKRSKIVNEFCNADY